MAATKKTRSDAWRLVLSCSATLLTLGVACAAQSPTEATSRPVATTAAPVSTASVAASGSAVPSATAVSSGQPAKRPPRSATPGKIACETVDCDLASEVCCVEKGAGRCAAKPSTPGADPCGPKAAERHCDEEADCGKGEACCQRLDCSQGGSPCVDPDSDDACVVRSRCEAKSKCYSGDWACLPQSSCSNGPCKDGHCPEPAPALACGGIQCGPGQTCCWDPVTRKGSCDCDTSGVGPGVGHLSVFACESPSGCGGGYGCFSSTGVMNYQDYHCGLVAMSCTRVIDHPYLCDQLSDCPPVVVGDTSTGNLDTVAPNGCRHDPTDPPSVKRCTYP